MKKKPSNIETKSENKQAVYRFIHTHGSATRQELFINLGLSLPTIKQSLEFLESIGLVCASDIIRNTGGRNATAYSIVNQGRVAIGIFLSTNHMIAVCVDLLGNILYKKRLNLTLDIYNDTYLKQAAQLVEDVISATNIPIDKFVGVGITVPGLVSEDNEYVTISLLRKLSGITRSILSKYIPYPTKLFHDSAAAGFAEVWQTSDIKNAVYLNLNSTIGGAVIIDNKMYRGNNQRSGEVGHMIIHPKTGKRCFCGQIGCFDTLCNTNVLDCHTNGNLEEFFALLKTDNPEIKAVWDTYLDDLALALHNIRMLYDCEIILGGYIGSYIEEYIDDLYKKVDALEVFNCFSREYVIPCKYKNEATAAGAAIQMIELFINTL